MRALDQENDVNIVRSYAKALEHRVLEADKQIRSLQALLGEQSQLQFSVADQLSRLEKKFFGFGRETRVDRPIGRKNEQLRLHAEHFPEDTGPLGEFIKEKSLDGPEVLIYDLNPFTMTEESASREITDPELQKLAWEEMSDFYQESTEITVTERTYKKLIHRQKKYRLKDAYNTTGKDVIITAPGPAKLRVGSKYSIDFALAVVSDKFEYHLPLERQRRKMEAQGLQVDVKTLYGLCEAVAEHGETLIGEIKEDMIADFTALHIDESPWRILGEKDTGQMWVLANRIGSIYRFEPTRSGQVAKELLKNYEGAVVTDGFSGYNAIRRSEKIRVQHCWAHARREFYERLSDYPDECGRALDLIDLIFAMEASAKTFDELKVLRKSEIKFVVEQFHAWLINTKPRFLPGEGISKAIEYCLKFWPELTLFLRDLTVPVDNNEAERALRHSVMGKKNFAGSKTINGADVAATLYTLIESAKKAAMQPREYLKYVITERWHGRKPLTPYRLCSKMRGLSKKVQFPEPHEWQI